jgi:hypothetical protein
MIHQQIIFQPAGHLYRARYRGSSQSVFVNEQFDAPSRLLAFYRPANEHRLRTTGTKSEPHKSKKKVGNKRRRSKRSRANNFKGIY